MTFISPPCSCEEMEEINTGIRNFSQGSVRTSHPKISVYKTLMWNTNNVQVNQKLKSYLIYWLQVNIGVVVSILCPATMNTAQTIIMNILPKLFPFQWLEINSLRYTFQFFMSYFKKRKLSHLTRNQMLVIQILKEQDNRN